MFFALKVTAGNDDAKEAKSRVQVSVGYPEELDFVLCNRPSLAIIRECSSLVHTASRPLAPIGCHQFLKADAPEPMFAPPTPTNPHYRLMPLRNCFGSHEANVHKHCSQNSAPEVARVHKNIKADPPCYQKSIRGLLA